MKIKYASIKVKNIKRSLEFYTKILDLDILDEYYSQNISVVMLTDGYVNLELIEDSSEDYGLDNIGLTVTDMDDIVERLDEYGVCYENQSISQEGHILSLSDYDGVNINIIQE